MRRDDGGPAFPGPWTNEGDLNATAPDGQVVPPNGTAQLPGMSFRDYVATKALQTLLVLEHGDPWDPSEADIDRPVGADVAMRAYAFADFMLKARHVR